MKAKEYVNYYTNKNKIRVKKNGLKKLMGVFQTSGSPEDLFKVHSSVVSVTELIKNNEKFKNNQNNAKKCKI